MSGSQYGRIRREVDIGEADLQSSPFLLHGKGGVGGEVHENLLHLHRGGEDRIRACVDSELDLNGGGNGSPRSWTVSLMRGDEGQGASRVIGLPAEGEDLLHEVPRPHGRFEDILQVLLHLGTVW